MRNTVPLEKVCNVTTGQSAPQDPTAFTEEGTPFIRAGSLEGLLTGTPENQFELVNEDNALKFRLKLFPKDTVIFAKSGMSAKIGRVYRLKCPCYLVSHLAAVSPSESVDPGYLHRWFEENSPSRLIENDAYPSIKTSVIKSVQIPLPPLEEQKRIAGILDAADALRAKRRQSLEHLDSLLQSTFLDMFGDPVTNPMGWKVAPLLTAVELENGDRSSNYPSGTDVIDEGILFLSTKNIVNCHLVYDECQFITQDKFDSLSRGKLQRNDIVITLRGTLGSCAVFDGRFHTGFINAQLMIIRPRKVDPLYLHSLLVSKPMRDHFSRVATGAAVKQLTGKQVGALMIPLPPVSLQHRFASIVESVEKQKALYQSQVAELDTLFASLQQRAFNGEL